MLAELLKGLAVTPSEIAYRTKLDQVVVLDVLCDLEEQGLAVPYAWKLGPEAQTP